MDRDPRVSFSVTTSERDLLVELLEHELQNLPPEIRRTDTPRYREELVQREDQVKGLLASLRTGEPDIREF